MTMWQSSTQALAPDVRRTGIITVLRSTRDGDEHALGTAPRRWLVGKAEGSDLLIDDPYVSSSHCVLERRANGGLFVRDKGSRNGTQVDGNFVEGAEIRVGSVLTIGRTTLVAVGAPGTEGARAIENLRGHDPAFRATVEQALRAAQTDCNVLIVGETGTGKDVIARVIHEASRRAAGKLVAVNCGGIPRELIASELFGHERGAFTGAHGERDGYFVEAHGGTLFLDELGELPLEMQPHLLRALETRSIRRVGGQHERAVNVRIIAATNRLAGLGTDSSTLRVDLYHRVATVVLVLPPLRERMGDIRELVESMLAADGVMPTIANEAWEALGGYNWPGNVRELRHAVSRALALGGDVLGPADFFPELRLGRRIQLGAVPLPPSDPLAPYQSMMRGAMEHALQAHGSIRAAASHLGMAKSTFADKAKAWGLVPRTRQRFGGK